MYMCVRCIDITILRLNFGITVWYFIALDSIILILNKCDFFVETKLQ